MTSSNDILDNLVLILTLTDIKIMSQKNDLSNIERLQTNDSFLKICPIKLSKTNLLNLANHICKK
jgi:hypothetical protein